jgi:DNA-binding MarR family transcriptional regulator
MAAAMTEKPKPEKPLPLDHWVSYRFGLIATRMGAIAAPTYVGRHKLSTSTWRALAVVARFEPLSAAMLSEHTRLDPSKVSRAIETLVRRKLLTREKDPADQRRAVLRLTARSRAMYCDIESTVVRLETEMVATLNAVERRALRSALDKIDAQVAKHRMAG